MAQAQLGLVVRARPGAATREGATHALASGGGVEVIEVDAWPAIHALPKTDLVLLLDADCELDSGGLEQLRRRLADDSSIGAAGPRLVARDGTVVAAGGLAWADGSLTPYAMGLPASAPEVEYTREADCVSMRALMVRRSALATAGDGYAGYQSAEYAGADLCLGLTAQGWRVVYEPGAEARLAIGSEEGPSDSDRGRLLHRRGEILAGHLPGGAPGELTSGRPPERGWVLVVDAWVPAPDRDSGSQRMYWILRLLRELGYRVTFFPLDRQPRGGYASALQALGVEVYAGAQDFEALIRTRAPLFDRVLVSRPTVAGAVVDAIRRHLPEAALIYDSVDLHFVRERRRLALEGAIASEEVETAERRELDLFAEADMSLAITGVEQRLVSARVPEAVVRVMPNVHDLPDHHLPGFDSRAGLVFIGGFDHLPNVDAVEFFVREVMPRLRSTVDARLVVIGANPPADIEALASDNVDVAGHVPEVRPYFDKARVFIAPLRYGAGMKGKIGHAMAYGLPVVTTSTGAEGMDLVDEVDALVADDPAAIAAAVTRLHQDPDLWSALSAAGRARVRRDWAPERSRLRLRALMAEAERLRDLRAAARQTSAASA